MAEAQNYTLGRGKVYFSRFKTSAGQVPSGFRYIGNTPEFNLTIESQDLQHFSSDEGIREEDDSVPLEVTRSGSMITDNIVPDNVALFFFGEKSTVTQLSASGQSETLTDVLAGHAYKLGASVSNPAGFFGIDPLGFEVGPTGVSLVKATGTLTITGVGTAGETITIGTTVYTLRAAVSDPFDVLIGANLTATTDNLKNAINNGSGEGTTYGTGTPPHPDVTAANTAGVLTATAREGGTPSNSIATTETSAVASWASATLTGGTGAALIEGTDYTVDYDRGFITFLADGVVNDGDDIDLDYSVLGSTRALVISGSTPVEGAMMYVEQNPKGSNSVYMFPWVKISPNGDYALKGDEWQQIPFNLKVLKTVNSEAILRNGLPAYT